jgi:hypothetical protein
VQPSAGRAHDSASHLSSLRAILAQGQVSARVGADVAKRLSLWACLCALRAFGDCAGHTPAGSGPDALPSLQARPRLDLDDPGSFSTLLRLRDLARRLGGLEFRARGRALLSRGFSVGA